MTQQVLWYNHPAENDWNAALPIGSGRLGAMVFGNVTEERVQLNEDSLWSGGPRDRCNPDARAALPVIRQFIREGRLQEASELTNESLCGVPDIMRQYEPLADLLISQCHGISTPMAVQTDADATSLQYFKNKATVTPDAYRRELDLERGTVLVTYRVGEITYYREYLASAVDNIIAIRLWADQPGAISLKARLERGPRDIYSARYVDTLHHEDQCALITSGATAGDQGIHFACYLRAATEGGSIRTIGETLSVVDADAVTLVITAATSFRSSTPEDESRACAKAALARGWEAIRADHLADHQSLFSRVELSLGEEHAATLDHLPTDERLARVRDGHPDPGLDALYFQYGRYLLIASSRPGTLPATLQGVWNQEMMPPWGSKYTININLQMNYWPVEVGNLSELHTPVFDLLERVRMSGRHTAEVMYGCRGFVCHHNTDIWADTCPTDRNLAATYWPMGGAWLCLHLWEHYAFTGDQVFLRQAYETMKESALFFLDFLSEDEKGRLVTSPSTSPENTYVLPNGEFGTLCAGPSMDNQILDTLFRRCISTAVILSLDEEFRETLETTRQRLPQPAIGKYGQLMEWPEDYEEIEPGHRHTSHLFALYPGDQITPRRTPELAEAARATLLRREAHGGGHTGWSRAWIINFWARLLDGERAYQNLQKLLGHSTLPNLFDNHPPFQIDGNFGGAAGIAEMLLQSVHEEIELLPALPAAWPSGSVKGLRARGGYELGMAWAQGQLTEVTITAHRDGACLLRYKDTIKQFEMRKGSTLILQGDLESCSQQCL